MSKNSRLYSDVPMHPGHFIKEEVLKPKKMSVTAAAKLIGISRPNVSNFLNGKADISTDMASRIERAFQVPAQELLDMQSAFDAAHAKSKGNPAGARAYVPPFLKIVAKDIENWSTRNLSARSRLSVLLRTLVHSTGVALTKVDFPGNDDSERAGWDGFVEASEGTPWIPEGPSGWEFGVNQDVKGKADGDFAKSVKAVNKQERENITFVFVTPRHWPAKSRWEEAAKAKKLFKDVRAYDSSDIEQWLEQSLVGQTWFANETGIPADGVRSLDKCWLDWANISEPPLPGALFNSAVEAATRTMKSRLSKAPDGPTIISADSVEEVLAFLSKLFDENSDSELSSYRDRTLVFDKLDVFSKLAGGAHKLIPVTHRRDVEREFSTYTKLLHCIIVYPRNAATTEAHITLEPVGHEAFRSALESAKWDRDKISRMADTSGRSLTVLRRQVSDVEAIRRPEWASNETVARSLIPFLLVGAWNSGNETDCEALGLIAGRTYSDLERDCQSIIRLNDAPLWSVGRFRGVISKLDLLYAIAGVLTRDDLERYFAMARLVLGEDDPALDLPDADRWAASIHDKSREFSEAFREGISETLVLLAVHGNKLFKSRLGIDAAREAELVVESLLSQPLSTRVLEANDGDLPTYAEAVPNTFLSIIERDLRTENPAVLGLLRPVDSGVFGMGPSRSGLLWALEGLAWNSETLPRVALILAKLAQVEIADNWVNKPINSLESVFRDWMPQTAANLEERLAVLRQITETFPDIGWKICIAQFGAYQQVGHYNHKPRWRTDGYGHGEPISTWGPILDFRREAVSMALNWNSYTDKMLNDLIERLPGLDSQHQTDVWNLVENWSANATDEEKASLREKIRCTTMTRRGRRRLKNSGLETMHQEAKAAYDELEPKDLLSKYAWLFHNAWVDESADELDDEELDFKKREERIRALRITALKEIQEKLGTKGLFKLSERSGAAWQIGRLLAQAVLDNSETLNFIRSASAKLLAENAVQSAYRSLISGVLHAVPHDILPTTLNALRKDLKTQCFNEVLLLAPFREITWSAVEDLEAEHKEAYWHSALADWIPDNEAENITAVEKLLEIGRPLAAFSCVRLQMEHVDASLMFRILSEMAQTTEEPVADGQLHDYSLERAFEVIDRSTALTLEQKAGLEFTYVEVLSKPWKEEDGYGTPNLERYVEAHPDIFVQAVVWMYKRSDGKDDPQEWKVEGKNAEYIAKRGYKLLSALRRTPGHDDLGELKAERLYKWINNVRDSCAELGRITVADLRIGDLLSHAPADDEGIWPCEPVRQVLEDLQSEDISRGVCTGLYNSRGVHWRGEGGDQERELAAKYRDWANALRYSHPYVSTTILMGMVNTYESEASQQDTEAGIRRRLR